MKKSCKKGYYYCFTSKKCKKIPAGHHVMGSGRLMKDSEHEEKEGGEESTETTKNGNGNGGNGGAVSEGWSNKYKKSIDCKNPKGFSQRAHCQGRKVNEAKEKDHEVSMAKTQVKKSIDNLQKVARVLAKKSDADNLPAWVQAKLTDTEHNTDAAASYMTGKEDLDEGKRDGKSAKDKGYSLRDWFKGGGWVQTGGKYDGKPCAKQPGQKTKPFCRDADDRAAMGKDEREKRAKKKRKEDPNPNRKGKAKMVREQVKLVDGESGAGALRRLFKNNKKLAGEVGGRPEDVLELPSDRKIKLAQHYELEGEVVSEKKDACYKKVKARYDVWPSAYASGALVKCRKVGAANWGNKTKKEGYEFSNWRDDFQPIEIETTDLIKPEPLISEQQANSQKDQQGMLGKSVGYDKPETNLQRANRELTTIRRLKQKTGLNVGTTSNNASYSDGNVSTNAFESKDPCWDGYKQLGMKKKGKKMVPNCVKEGYSNWREELAESDSRFGRGEMGEPKGTQYPKVDPEKYKKDMEFWKRHLQTAPPVRSASTKNTNKTTQVAHFEPEGELIEDWQKVNKKDKTDGMSQKAVDAYKRENPGSKLKTAVTEKNPGGKRAKRRKSFCARSNGQRKMHNIDCSKTPDKAICKARKRWRC